LTVKPGVDVLLDEPRAYLGFDRVGLVTNPTGVTSRLESTLDEFHKHDKINLSAVFGPEHGVRGDIQDALDVPNHMDPYTDLPVYSLYGEHRAPTGELLDGVDILVFDIQDCGSRFYTYVSTLTYCMESAARYGVKVVVLDRPNPINGDIVEGNILEQGYDSFIGLHPVPIRHGLTTGELASLINNGINCELSVVPMKGWHREHWFDETGLPWIQPSPNLPSLDTATVYPGTCFFEGINASEGRGTTRPFEYLGAPWVDEKKWAESLNILGLPGVKFRGCHFTPAFWGFKDTRCNGVQVHVTDRDLFKPVETGVHLLSTLRQQHPDEFKFKDPTYESRRHFDLLAGTNSLREQLERNTPVDNIVGSWEVETKRYLKKRESHLIYEWGV
jgi:beta-N-acetylhexosaminidase